MGAAASNGPALGQDNVTGTASQIPGGGNPAGGNPATGNQPRSGHSFPGPGQQLQIRRSQPHLHRVEIRFV